MRLEIVDGGSRCTVHLVVAARHTQTQKFGDIVIQRLGRIVRQEGIAYTQLAEFFQKRYCIWEKSISEIYGTVHVKCDVPDARQLFFELLIHCCSILWFFPYPEPRQVRKQG